MDYRDTAIRLDGDGGIWAMTVRVTPRQLQAYDHFLKAGLYEKGAAALVGNFVQESGENLDSTMFRAHPDASGGVPQELKSGGIAEWLGDRKTACIAFSRAAEVLGRLPSGSLLNDLETQCDFVVHELTTDPRYATLYNQLTTDTGRSIATLTANFCWEYERPNRAAANLGGDRTRPPGRIDFAEAIHARAQMIKAAKEPQPAPTAPIPVPPAPQAPIPAQHRPMEPAGPVLTGPPISASTAGRQAAVRDMLEAMRANYVAELVSIETEISIIDTTIADFEKLAPVPAIHAIAAPLALQKPAGHSATTTQRNIIMELSPQILATIRSALLGIGGFFVGKGVVDNSTMVSIVGGVMWALPAVWSVWGHRQAGIIAAAAALPDVHKIVTTPAIAGSPEFVRNSTVVSGG